jgi:hypothetical protein
MISQRVSLSQKYPIKFINPINLFDMFGINYYSFFEKQKGEGT